MTHKDSIKESIHESLKAIGYTNITEGVIDAIIDEAKAEGARERDEEILEMLLKLDQDGGYDEAWYSAIKMVRSLLSPRSKDGDVE